jgi:glutathione S-transferase
MEPLTLVIGNKNYSSWSLRPWLALKLAGLAFEEIRIPLYQATSKQEILRHSPAGKVPVLKHGEIRVWESLAICEYVAELAPQARLWPEDQAARAHARSVSAEMHAGFSALRHALPMNLRVQDARVKLTPEVQTDVGRIATIWEKCRAKFGAGGGFLYGHFTIADAMYAPVVTRFISYGVKLEGRPADYMNAVWALPELQEWVKAGAAETERLAETDAVAEM